VKIQWHLAPGRQKSDFTEPAVLIGIFDGVHLGHQELVDRARTLSDRVIALTFYPHPTALLAPDRVPKELLSLADRIGALFIAGVGAVAVIEFSAEFASMSAGEFIEKVLKRELGAKSIVVGANFTFGNKASGNVETLKLEKSFSVASVELMVDGSEVISSTRIRALIEAGEVEEAEEYLSRPHQVTGIVIHGEKRGREIGYPTANLEVTVNSAIPKEGVYAGWLSVGTSRWQAAISIGRNPTFPREDGERGISVEAYAIDQVDLDLYDQMARIEFGFRLRDTLKFESLPELLDQMAIDVERARELTATEADQRFQ
jgi:riboflavin kinase/FMN adenylyltransferase